LRQALEPRFPAPSARTARLPSGGLERGGLRAGRDRASGDDPAPVRDPRRIAGPPATIRLGLAATWAKMRRCPPLGRRDRDLRRRNGPTRSRLASLPPADADVGATGNAPVLRGNTRPDWGGGAARARP